MVLKRRLIFNEESGKEAMMEREGMATDTLTALLRRLNQINWPLKGRISVLSYHWAECRGCGNICSFLLSWLQIACDLGLLAVATGSFSRGSGNVVGSCAHEMEFQEIKAYFKSPSSSPTRLHFPTPLFPLSPCGRLPGASDPSP